MNTHSPKSQGYRAPTSQNHNLRICLMYKPSLLARVHKNYHATYPFYKYHATGRLTHDLIIVRLRKALDKWIAFENKSNEHQYPTEQ
jgi:hypothetical protein